MLWPTAGSGQLASATTAFPVLLSATVEDQYGNPVLVAGTSVTAPGPRLSSPHPDSVLVRKTDREIQFGRAASSVEVVDDVHGSRAVE